MQTILFHIYPALSHFYSSFKIAKLLNDAGYRIVYIGSTTFKYVAEKAGFKYEIIDDIVDNTSYEIKTKGLIKFINQSFKEFIDDERYKITNLKVEYLKRKVEKIKPDLVLIDAHFINIAIYYQYFGYKMAAITMMPYSGKDTLVPPFNSWVIPKNNFIFKTYIDYLWFKNKIRKRLIFVFNNLVSFGQDERTLKKRFARATGFNFKKHFDYDRAYVNGYKHLIEFVLVPKTFDFPRTNITNVHFLGLNIDRSRENEMTDLRYLGIIDRIKQQKIKHDKVKLIYCSLGTLTHLDIKVTECFFKKIVSLCHTFKDFVFILSVGTSYDVQKLLPLPPNIYIFTSVPQIDLLSHSDAMITHGGMNSILECIELGVPMLVYPLSKKWDQPGNSARVVYYGLGLRGNIRHDSVKVIAQKIFRLIGNKAQYKANLLKMKENIEKENKPSDIVKFIGNVIDG